MHDFHLHFNNFNFNCQIKSLRASNFKRERQLMFVFAQTITSKVVFSTKSFFSENTVNIKLKMSESPIPVTKDPSLKRYFKFMLTNRKMSVQFTSGKIREIIETDLGIKLPQRQSLYSRVCIEAFAYYMQSWPEWNLAIKSKYSDALYDCLITYLRGKLLNLKDRELNYRQSTAENVILNLPENMHISRKKGLKKIRSPYNIKVFVPHQSWKTDDVCLRNYGTNHVYVELKKPKAQEMDMGILETLNYPFVQIEVYIPGFIHFIRKTPFHIERFLQTATDELKDMDFIFKNVYAITNTDMKSAHKAYSYRFMKTLLFSLNQTLLYYKNECLDSHVQNIAIIIEQLLADIYEAGPQKTICEGSSVTFNIGKKAYYIDSELSTQNIQSEQLVFKKIMTPVVEYTLAFCHMTNANINNGKFDFLDFSDMKDPLKLMLFFNRIKNCLKFKCTLCDLDFDAVDLKNHMLINHSLETKLKCIKCQKIVRISKLLPKRWKHDCNANPIISTNSNNITI